MSAPDVSTLAAAEGLAARILAPRDMPLVVISTTPDGAFDFDIERVRIDLEGVADVVGLLTGTVTRHLEELLPLKTNVFNGAARCYPPDFHDDPAWHRSYLRFPEYSTEADLIADAMAQSTGRTIEPSTAHVRRHATGVVIGFLADGSRAMAELEDGRTIPVTAALLPPGTRLDQVLRKAATVTGVFDGEVLTPEPVEFDASTFVEGDHTLALVTKVTERRAYISLFPGHEYPLRMRDITADESGRADMIFSAGEVIRVRVTRDTTEALRLSHSTVDPEAPLVPALAVVSDGPPWLTEDATFGDTTIVASAPEPHAPPASDRPAPPGPMPLDYATKADVHSLVVEMRTMRSELYTLTNFVARVMGGAVIADPEHERMRAENERLAAQLDVERQERARAEHRLAELSTMKRVGSNRPVRATDAPVTRPPRTEEELRSEVRRTWQQRVGDGERDEWPLRDYRIGPAFLGTWEALDPTQTTKALKAVVDVVTGRAHTIPGREVHRLRTGDAGNAPYVVRADGAQCWRCAIENATPSARRLHYWMLPDDGGIELSRLVLHDDMKP